MNYRKYKYLSILSLIAFFALFVVGCGDPSVSGKVLLADGTPVTAGKVYFESGSFAATGTIQKDGSYRMGTTKEGNGVPTGKYKVAIMGAVLNEFPDSDKEQKGGLGMITIRKPIVFINLVDQKYTSVATSGLEIEVKGSMKHDIVVDPPAK